MECRTSLLLGLTLALFCGLSSSEVVKTQKCHLAKGQVRNCDIHEVRVDPCPQAAENKPCKIKVGTNSSATFDYTPKWGTTKPGSLMYKVGEIVDMPFELMDSNGCLRTNCPIEANKQQSWSYNLVLDKKFSALGIHQIKVKLWNEDDYHQQCCFKFSLHIEE